MLTIVVERKQMLYVPDTGNCIPFQLCIL